MTIRKTTRTTGKRNPNSSSPTERPNDAENPTDHGASTASNKENLPVPCADKNRHEYSVDEMQEARKGGVRNPKTHIGTYKSPGNASGHDIYAPYSSRPDL